MENTSEGSSSPERAPDESALPEQKQLDIETELQQFDRMQDAGRQLIRQAIGDESNTDEVKRQEIEKNQRRINQAEKVKKLRFEVLTPDHLCHIEELYNKHLLSSDALSKWKSGDISQIVDEIQKRGRMFNEFDPDAETLEFYRKINPSYKPVRQQMQEDMEESERGDSPRGHYVVVGFYDDKKPNTLRGSLSMRYPPRDPGYRKQYAEHLKDFLTAKDKLEKGEMQYGREWDIPRMEKEFPNMAEIDTINIETGFSGASYLLLHRAIELMKDRGFEDPESMIYYRSHTMSRRDMPSEAINIQNLSSAQFFQNLGFTEIAKRCDENDIVVRRIDDDDEWLIINMQWEYGHKSFVRLQARLAELLKKRHLN